MELLSVILVWRDIKDFKRAAINSGLSLDHFEHYFAGVKVKRKGYWALRVEIPKSAEFQSDKPIFQSCAWVDFSLYIFLEHSDGRISSYREPAVQAQDEDLAISNVLEDFIERNGLPLYTGPMEGVKPLTLKKPRNGSRENATGERHYAAKHDDTVKTMNAAFSKKANGLHRLEVALIKYLDGVDYDVVRDALNQTRAAQEDTDFHALWKLLDDKASATNAGSDKV